MASLATSCRSLEAVERTWRKDSPLTIGTHGSVGSSLDLAVLRSEGSMHHSPHLGC